MRDYCDYVMTNRSGTLYVGVTNDLARRVAEHGSASLSQFTGRYRMNRLLYVEVTTDLRAAIAREKQIKGWTQARKIALFSETNPRWEDLSPHFVETSACPGLLDSSLRSE